MDSQPINQHLERESKWLTDKKTIFFMIITMAIVVSVGVGLSQLEYEAERHTNPVVIERPVASNDMHLSQGVKDLRTQLDKFIEMNARDKVTNITVTNQKFEDLNQALHTISTAFEKQEVYFKEIEERLDENREMIVSSINYQNKDNKDKLQYKDLLIFNKPPFRLLAVEYWEGAPTAILALNDKTKSVQLGDYVAKWKILKIDVLNRVIDISHKSDLLKITTLEVGA